MFNPHNMTSFWPRRRVFVTGGGGFLGSRVVDLLARAGADVCAPPRRECDLLERDAVDAALGDFRPQMLVHLAATVGGIGANRENPGRFFYENALMGITLIEAARRHGIGKTVVLGTVCAYPKFTPVPFREVDLWQGYPEETNAPYGIAKKALLVQLQAYRQQYGMNGIFLIPVNLYGPRDNFDPRSSHVIPALIRKVVEARTTGAPFVEIWGSGRASREFLYVDDCARAIQLAAERYDGLEPVNLGTGEEINISDLARLIADLCDYRGELRFNASYPDGQPRRKLDTTRAKQEFGFRASIGFREGLRRTIEWYRSVSTAGATAQSASAVATEPARIESAP